MTINLPSKITLQYSPPYLVTENTVPLCEKAEEEEKPPGNNIQNNKGVKNLYHYKCSLNDCLIFY